jgi:hypothetical protein
MIKIEDLPTDPLDSNANAKETENWEVQRPRERGQQDVETQDKNFASYIWNTRNN